MNVLKKEISKNIMVHKRDKFNFWTTTYTYNGKKICSARAIVKNCQYDKPTSYYEYKRLRNIFIQIVMEGHDYDSNRL